jgi:DNA cross-link repair 1C protein
MPSPSIFSQPRPSLNEILTCDPSATRFHACERFNQCDVVKAEEPQLIKRRTHRASMVNNKPVKRVVYINPGAMTGDAWGTFILDVSDRLKSGQFVDTLRVPMSRHSTLVSF